MSFFFLTLNGALDSLVTVLHICLAVAVCSVNVLFA